MEKLIVTRHESLAEYIKEKKLVPPDTPVHTHVTPAEIKGKHVYGILPLNLAINASRITVIPLGPPRNLRGKELNLEEIRKIAHEPRTVEVSEIATTYHE